jgi:RimJ/RimL family protein N-acetyltransferase
MRSTAVGACACANPSGPKGCESRFSARYRARLRCQTLRVEPPTIQIDSQFILDGWKLEDASAHREFAEDAAAARFLGWTVEDARALPDSHYVGVVERFQAEWNDGSRLSLAIRDTANGRAVGAVELRPRAGAMDVSYVVAPAFRRRGLASRAVTAVLSWAERELNVGVVLLNCHPDNLASQRVAEKCGFREVGSDTSEIRFARDL